MSFDLDRAISEAKARVHRSIGQRARHAHRKIAMLASDIEMLAGDSFVFVLHPDDNEYWARELRGTPALLRGELGTYEC